MVVLVGTKRFDIWGRRDVMAPFTLIVTFMHDTSWGNVEYCSKKKQKKTGFHPLKKNGENLLKNAWDRSKNQN